MKPIYSDPNMTPTQKDLLETMIGAAIWYMPSSEELWTGRISIDALKALRSGETICKHHNYPRKLAGRDLLCLADHDLTNTKSLQLYKEKFGRFNKVTKAENKRLVQYQREHSFINPEEAYRSAGIRLLDENDLKPLAAASGASNL